MKYKPDIRSNLDFDSLGYYLKEISKYSLLPFEKEQELALKIKQGDLEARTQFINSNLRIVVFRAKKFVYFKLPLLDLINEGNFGLIKAVDRYDPEKYKTRFTTYAVWWIDQAIKKAIVEQVDPIKIPVWFSRKRKYLEKRLEYEPELLKTEFNELTRKLNLTKPALSRLLTFKENTISLNSILEDNFEILEYLADPTDYNEQINQEIFQKEVCENLNRLLSPRELSILRYRFGLENTLPLTLEQVAEKMGVTRERIRQIQKKAISKLADFYTNL